MSARRNLYTIVEERCEKHDGRRCLETIQEEMTSPERMLACAHTQNTCLPHMAEKGNKSRLRRQGASHNAFRDMDTTEKVAVVKLATMKYHLEKGCR